jgi:hypothetical protein
MEYNISNLAVGWRIVTDLVDDKGQMARPNSDQHSKKDRKIYFAKSHLAVIAMATHIAA